MVNEWATISTRTIFYGHGRPRLGAITIITQRFGHSELVRIYKAGKIINLHWTHHRVPWSPLA